LKTECSEQAQKFEKQQQAASKLKEKEGVAIYNTVRHYRSINFKVCKEKARN
jgi:hypothetical protein